MRMLLAPAFALLLATSAVSQTADPASDAPERRYATAPVQAVANYAEALSRWNDADDVNAWIGANFAYDMQRALRLSETQRQRGGRLPIHAPDAFFAQPSGVCVDLARFAVETLRAIAPESRPRYLMIEFDPVAIAGNTLRRHWVAGFERDGALFFFADSKRPGLISGPYPSAAAFLADYAQYRGRRIVAHQELDTYEKRQRMLAARQPRDAKP